MPTRREILRTLGRLEGPIARAFAEAVRQMRSRARISALEAAIEAGDIDRAMRAAGIRDGGWSQLTEQVRATYIEGGQLYASDAPQQLGFAFNVTNPRAERWLREQSSTMIRQINDDQREAIRATVQAGQSLGQNPRKTALDIVGRVNRRTGRREGGTVGLTANQSRYVANAKAQLLSGDPAEMRKYLDRERRDRRFDGIVKRAIAEERPVSQADVDRLTTRYSDRLLQTRGETVARTEAISSLNAGAQESLEQAVEEGLVNEGRIERVWRASLGGRTRDTHAAMNGQVTTLREPFISPSGAQLMYPGDPSAPAAERINCFAPWSLVAVSGLKRAIRSHYVGDLVKVSAGGVVDFTVTPNHPVLTQRGWVGAGFLVEGDQLIDCGAADRFLIGVEPEIGDAVTRAQDLYDSAEALGVRGRAGFGSVNFHGEVPTEDVDVVSLDRGLWDRFNSGVAERFGHFTLADTDVSLGRAIFDRIIRLGDGALPVNPDRPVGRFGATGPLFRGREAGGSSIAFGYIRALYPKIFKALVNRTAPDADFVRYPEDGVATVEQSLHVREEFGALPLGPFCVFGGHGSPAPLGVVLDAHIPKALDGVPVGLVDAFGDRRDGSALIVKALDFAVKFLAARKVPFLGRLAGLQFDPGFARPCADRGVVDAGLVGNGFGAFSTAEEVEAKGDRLFSVAGVSEVEHFHYEGPVYNFETNNGLIVTGNTIAHNCRCTVQENVDWISP